ncbi:MAG: flagellar basal body-associated FliL family protein [Deltaproteobacteria bacterium]|jgi:flagellar FliL protein|nr:flagellar basal body-associated FliL family protein [Deltaproteobacteria bacterium]
MAAKEGKPPKKQQEEAPDKGSRDQGQSKDAPKAKGGGLGGLKLIIVLVAAVFLGCAATFAAVKFLLLPAAGTAPAPAGEERVAAEPPREAGTAQASTAPAEEPIVAPTKSGSGKAEEGGAAKEGGGAEGAAAADLGPVVVKLDPFTTNLNEPSGRRYLKLTLSMEVDNQEAADDLNRKMDLIKNDILMLLSSQSMSDISDLDGKLRLQSQILNRANNHMQTFKVRKVLFSEFVIQ